MIREPVIPIGARVELIQTGWRGVVIRHLPPNSEDRATSACAYLVRWDANGVEGRVRSSKRLRVNTPEPHNV